MLLLFSCSSKVPQGSVLFYQEPLGRGKIQLQLIHRTISYIFPECDCSGNIVQSLELINIPKKTELSLELKGDAEITILVKKNITKLLINSLTNELTTPQFELSINGTIPADENNSRIPRCNTVTIK